MGDVVCMLPMIREVREQYPHAIITVIVNKPMIAEILKGSGIKLDKILSINAHAQKWSFLKTCLGLRREHFDLSISAANTPVNKARLMMGIIGAKKKAGIQYSLRRNYNGLNDKYHFVDANLLILKELGIENHHYSPALVADINLTERLKQTFNGDKPVIGVCIGRADISFKNKRKRTEPVYTRGWGDFHLHVQNMETLVKMILGKKWQVILIGGIAELEIHDALSEEVLCHPYCFDYVGKTTVSESIALAGICDVVAGVDTGMQHIADAAGTKTVSIFGPTNPKTHGAYSSNAYFAESNEQCRCCYGTENYENCSSRKCLTNILPNQVFNLIEKAIEEIQRK